MKRRTTGSIAGFATMFLVLSAGCGDDSGGGSGAGGTSAGATTTGGTTGATMAATGGTGAGTAGTTAGMMAAPSPADVAACVAAGDTASAMGFMTRSQECKDCICGKCTTAEVMACDDVCWQLIQCAGDKCAGLPDAERTACAVMMCLDFLPKAAQATAIGNCAFPADGVDSCETACRVMPDGGLPMPDAGSGS